MPKERRFSQLLCLPDAQNQILFLNIGEGIQWEESGYIGFYSFANTKTSEILYQIADFLTNWSDDKSRDDWSWKGWSTWSCSNISQPFYWRYSIFLLLSLFTILQPASCMAAVY
jgi:hypothetical protein